MRDALHDDDQLERSVGGQQKVKRPILLIGLKDLVEAEQGREKRGNPEYRGSDL